MHFLRVYAPADPTTTTTTTTTTCCFSSSLPCTRMPPGATTSRSCSGHAWLSQCTCLLCCQKRKLDEKIGVSYATKSMHGQSVGVHQKLQLPTLAWKGQLPLWRWWQLPLRGFGEQAAALKQENVSGDLRRHWLLGRSSCNRQQMRETQNLHYPQAWTLLRSSPRWRTWQDIMPGRRTPSQPRCSGYLRPGSS